ncbi:MAG: hypothetical protein WCI84_10985 [Bacteroidota bacterium]
MTQNEELLQRCFDGDVNDEEMKNLFVVLCKDGGLRNTFRSLQMLRRDLHSIPVPNVSPALDERIKTLNKYSLLRLLPDRPSLKKFTAKKITMSVPAIAAALLLMVIGSYFAATTIEVTPKPETEYVYVVEMPAYVVQSSYQTIKNN